jgi:hypothetical protein
MANIKISELTNAATLDGTEYVAINQNNQTVKTTTGAIAALGGPSYDLLIEKNLYSHVAAFDNISLPAKYSDYTHLILFITEEAANEHLLELVMPSVIKYYESYNEVPNQLILPIDTSTITGSDQNIQIPILEGNKIVFGIWGQTRINSSRIQGYNYGWSWRNLYLYAYGANIGG